MKITEIIKDAFLFPSKNTGRYAIYLLLSVLIVLFALGGVLTNALGIIDGEKKPLVNLDKYNREIKK